MSDVVERESLWVFSRTQLGAVIVCVLAFGASSGLPNRALNHWVSSVFGIAMVLYGIAPALRDVSDDVQRWARLGGSLAFGAALGLLFRLITR